MSKLIHGLKGKNKLEGKVSIYFPKKSLHDFQIKDLKRIWKLRESSEVIKSCLSFYAFYSLDISEELYKQLKYNKIPNEFFSKQEMFREKTTLKKFEEEFIKVEVLNWHLIVSLNKYDGVFEDNFDVVRDIIRFSWEHLVNLYNFRREETFKEETFKEETFKEETFILGIPNIFQKNVHKLKILHGNHNESNLIKKCIEYYVYSIHFNNISSHIKSSSSEAFLDEATGYNQKKLKLSTSFAETLNFHHDRVNDIQEIFAYNLKIFQNLFPERNINDGKST